MGRRLELCRRADQERAWRELGRPRLLGTEQLPSRTGCACAGEMLGFPVHWKCRKCVETSDPDQFDDSFQQLSTVCSNTCVGAGIFPTNAVTWALMWWVALPQAL